MAPRTTPSPNPRPAGAWRRRPPRERLEGDERILDAGCGSGRVTAPAGSRARGRVVALDGSPAMLDQARGASPGSAIGSSSSRRTCGPAPRSRPGRRDPLDRDVPLDPRPRGAVPPPRGRDPAGGQLVAQYGGVGNTASVRAVLATIGDGWTGDVFFAGPDETRGWLAETGWEDGEAWLQPEPTRFEPGEPFKAFLRTVILGAHLARLPAGERDAFVDEVASRLPAAEIDYVRLNVTARRGGWPSATARRGTARRGRARRRLPPRGPGPDGVELRLVRRVRVDLRRPVGQPPQVGHRPGPSSAFDDQRRVLVRVAGRQPGAFGDSCQPSPVWSSQRSSL